MVNWVPSIIRVRHSTRARLGAIGAAAVVLVAGLVAIDAPPSFAAADVTVMAQTQRMSGPTLSSTQNGVYEKTQRISVVCHQRGQAVKGYFSQWLPNGGWDDLWYLVSDGYFAADVDLETGSNTPVAPACPVPFDSAPTPTISGIAKTGETLTASPGSWSPGAALSYRWTVNGSVVSTAATWTPPATAGGATVAVAVTGARVGYTTITRESAPLKIAPNALTVASPTISGAFTVGQTLTAKPGTWAPSPVKLGYEWLRDGTTIKGATASTYKIVAADAGKKVSVRVTGTKANYPTASKTSTSSVVNRGLEKTPVPTIAGTARVGSTLTASAGTWAPSPVTLIHQWMRDGSAIKGATGKTYTLVAADAGRSITVQVTGKKSGYTAAVKTSAAKKIESILTAAVPTIAGTPTVGLKLTAKAGAWGPAPVTLTFQWLRNGAVISGATAATLTLGKTDAGASISVKVTAKKAGYTSASRTSATVAVGNALTAAPTPTLSGTAEEGQTLTAVPGVWAPSGVTLAYRWFRDKTPISGATRKAYTLTAADVGTSITVTVTGSKSGYTAITKRSAVVTPVGLAIIGITPTITGTAQAGGTLTAVPGTWGPSPVALSYQWAVNGSAVGGATGSTWTVPVWAATKTITVSVTGARSGYPSVSLTSGGVGVSGIVGSSVGPYNSMPPGSSLLSANGQYSFHVQTDGNLVVYKGSTALWGSRTDGQAPREFAIQGDGNLVLYRTDGRAVWESRTTGKSIAYLAMQDDGNLVLYATNGSAIWATGTAQGGGGGGSNAGVNGWVYPIQPHSRLTTYSGHNGDDFPVPNGTPVYAMAGGTVKISSYAVTSGWCPVPAAVGRTQTDLVITSSRDGRTYAIDYAHLSSFAVGNGATVAAGQLIGYSGDRGCVTGPHLHVDIKVDGQANRLYPHDIFGWSY